MKWSTTVNKRGELRELHFRDLQNDKDLSRAIDVIRDILFVREQLYND